MRRVVVYSLIGGLALIGLVVVLNGGFGSSGQGSDIEDGHDGTLGGATQRSALPVPAIRERRVGSTYRPSKSESILGTVEDYWAQMQHHEFMAAFETFVPGALDLTRAEFIAREEHRDIRSASFRGVLTATAPSSASTESNPSGASTATVAVVSLITHDGLNGCTAWSGSYTLIVEDTFWRILRQALVPRPCS